MERPELIENPNLEELKTLLQDYIDFLDSEDYHEDNDYEHYIYEETLKTFFGRKVFNFINSKD